jgi:hypothetical protein
MSGARAMPGASASEGVTPADLGFDPTDPVFIADPPASKLELDFAFGALLRGVRPGLEALRVRV